MGGVSFYISIINSIKVCRMSRAKKSTVNKAGNYTKPTLRKRIFQRIMNSNSYGTPSGKWSGRKAQALAKAYKKAGGGYR